MRLFLDDVRQPPEGYDIQTFNYAATVAVLQTNKVKHISLDHDLGDDVKGSGYDVACWIEVHAAAGDLPRMTWCVHSMNPIGADRIRVAMKNADRFWALTPD